MVLRLMDPNKHDRESFERLQGLLSRATISIQSIMSIYREPTFKFFVDFLKENVVAEDRLPKFIMALPIKPGEKLVMLGGVQGMIYAIHNPEVTLRSWYFDADDLAGDTSHIVAAFRERRIER